MDNETKTGTWKRVLVKSYGPKEDTFSVDIEQEEEKF